MEECAYCKEATEARVEGLCQNCDAFARAYRLSPPPHPRRLYD